jgi:hypothetical protein
MMDRIASVVMQRSLPRLRGRAGVGRLGFRRSSEKSPHPRYVVTATTATVTAHHTTGEISFVLPLRGEALAA